MFYDKGSVHDPSFKTFVDARKDKVQGEQVIAYIIKEGELQQSEAVMGEIEEVTVVFYRFQKRAKTMFLINTLIDTVSHISNRFEVESYFIG